jgi:hypothetical protein
MAWMMGYIKQGKLKNGSLYIRWVDAKTSEPVEDKDVRTKYSGKRKGQINGNHAQVLHASSRVNTLFRIYVRSERLETDNEIRRQQRLPTHVDIVIQMLSEGYVAVP